MKAENALIAAIENAITGVKLFQDLLGLVYNGPSIGDPITIVMDGHTPATYVAWINSMFLGYRGWLNYAGEDLPSTNFSAAYSNIGASCFSGCSGVGAITFTDGARYVGSNAFYNCVNATEITIPVDYG